MSLFSKLIFISLLSFSAYAQTQKESVIPYHGYGLLLVWGILIEFPLLAVKSKHMKLHMALFAILDLWTILSVFFVSKESKQ